MLKLEDDLVIFLPLILVADFGGCLGLWVWLAPWVGGLGLWGLLCGPAWGALENEIRFPFGLLLKVFWPGTARPLKGTRGFHIDVVRLLEPPNQDTIKALLVIADSLCKPTGLG